jgi:hypothetical protein
MRSERHGEPLALLLVTANLVDVNPDHCKGRGAHRRCGVPGEEFVEVLYDAVAMEAYEVQRMPVVGGRDRAIESAPGPASPRGSAVTLSRRDREVARVKDRNRGTLDLEAGAKTG